MNKWIAMLERRSIADKKRLNPIRNEVMIKPEHRVQIRVQTHKGKIINRPKNSVSIDEGSGVVLTHEEKIMTKLEQQVILPAQEAIELVARELREWPAEPKLNYKFLDHTGWWVHRTTNLETFITNGIFFIDRSTWLNAKVLFANSERAKVKLTDKTKESDMNLGDLKEGTRLEFRNGMHGLVIRNEEGAKFILRSDLASFRILGQWDEGLLYYKRSICRDLDIVKVWSSNLKQELACNLHYKLECDPAWERKEVKSVGMGQALQILEAHFECEVKIAGVISES